MTATSQQTPNALDRGRPPSKGSNIPCVASPQSGEELHSGVRIGGQIHKMHGVVKIPTAIADRKKQFK